MSYTFYYTLLFPPCLTVNLERTRYQEHCPAQLFKGSKALNRLHCLKSFKVLWALKINLFGQQKGVFSREFFSFLFENQPWVDWGTQLKGFLNNPESCCAKHTLCGGFCGALWEAGTLPGSKAKPPFRPVNGSQSVKSLNVNKSRPSWSLAACSLQLISASKSSRFLRDKASCVCARVCVLRTV